jgi:hypothetical protein
MREESLALDMSGDPRIQELSAIEVENPGKVGAGRTERKMSEGTAGTRDGSRIPQEEKLCVVHLV